MFSLFHRGTEVPPDHRSEPAPAPSPLLFHLAGEHAPALAEVWPAPHEPFLAAPASRRHLACLLLSLEQPVTRLEVETALTGAVDRSLRDAGAPRALKRSLSRLGEVAWGAEDYRRLLRCLAQPGTAKLLHHAEQISVEQVRMLDALPAPISAAGGLKVKVDAVQADLLDRAFRAIAARDGEARGAQVAGAWAKADNLKALFEAARRDIHPQTGPHPLGETTRFKALNTRAALDEAGARYKNCLGWNHHQSPGNAFYEWLGEPGMVVWLYDDWLNGWTLNEAKLADNRTPPPAVREPVMADLRAAGVHTGPGGCRLANDLAAAAYRSEPCAPQDAWIQDVFGYDEV